MSIEPWKLAMFDAAGYNGIRDEHIAAVAREIEKLPGDVVDTADFRSACYRAGVDPDNFTRSDLDDLQDYLDR